VNRRAGPNIMRARDNAAGLPCEAESSTQLLALAQRGDRDALEQLVARYLPRLQRWATGRLPAWARDLADTQDLVQETLVRAFRRVEAFDPRGEGALQAYVRQVLLNRIREELRRAGRRPATETLEEDHPDRAESPLEKAIGREAVERYERALKRMRPSEREAIVMRVELGCSYDEVAAALGKPNANAARSAVTRALRRLIEEMRDGRAR
jgi:RNA polymerase sigma factor (sigma-70 family)